MKKSILLFILVILTIPIAIAESGHLKLLAVSEINGSYKGSIADLYLEIKKGTGRVFLETFPLTKFDTQISTRFAKEIACNYVDADCDKYDFFYTINANSPIVAGASAGSSIALLTVSLIKDLEIDENIATTGTINSGGLVGPVGGLKEKIEAAKSEGLTKVLIPSGGKITIDENKTTSAENLSKELDIEVIEVSTLREVIEEFTGIKIEEDERNIDLNQDYLDTMAFLAEDLCTRSKTLSTSLNKLEIKDNTSLNRAENLTLKGAEAVQQNSHYSAASYCFGANVEYSYLLLSAQDLNKKEIKQKQNSVQKSINLLFEKINKDKIKTITDLESYMIVTERLIEANDFLDIVSESANQTEQQIRNLAYATERLKSANSWSKFLDNRGKEFTLNAEELESSCKVKLLEAEERYQYANLYFPATLQATRKQLDYAYADLDDKNFALCIFKASKAKASLDIILSVFYVEDDQVDTILDNKLEIVKRNIVKQIDKEIFPVLGYSYYEYSKSLKNDDPYSSLLYAEYALELGNLDLYFKEKKNMFIESLREIELSYIWIFAVGLFLGSLVTLLSQKKRLDTKKPSKKRIPAGKKR